MDDPFIFTPILLSIIIITRYMDYYLKRNCQPTIDMIPNNYNDYIELIDNYMIQERHKNIVVQFEDKRRQSVSRLPDINQHCFRLEEDRPAQVQYAEQDQDNRDQQLRRRIQQYNRVMKPNREKGERQRRARRNQNQRGEGHKRKVRTTITQAKLDQMNKIFSQFLQARQKNKGQNYEDDDYLGSQQYQKNQHNSLKSIGQKLGLGYSTILHKFRQFRATKKVKGGALIAAMHQKRKYRKSMEIQGYIADSLKSHKFYTAVELSKYIQQRYDVTLSRSIISRHLGQMGFSYKNVKSKSPNKNSDNLKDFRKKVGLSINYFKERKNGSIYYLDELCLNVKQFISQERQGELSNQLQHVEELVVLLFSNSSGIIKYLLKDGHISEYQFEQFLQEARERIRDQSHSQIIVLDMDYKVHYTQRIAIFRQQIRKENMSFYYLPPLSHQMSMLQWLNPKIKNELLKYSYERVDDLKHQIKNILQTLAYPCQNELIQVSAKESQEYLLRACNSQDFDQ